MRLRVSVMWLKAGQLLFGGVVGSGVLDVCVGVCVVEGCGRRVIVWVCVVEGCGRRVIV